MPHRESQISAGGSALNGTEKKPDQPFLRIPRMTAGGRMTAATTIPTALRTSGRIKLNVSRFMAQTPDRFTKLHEAITSKEGSYLV